ncbi:hypothetical protein J6590_001406 [Homalodisca vitripennis]|nr:hypothetical protein J6590_001406 [Homalodisca vitripennis]
MYAHFVFKAFDVNCNGAISFRDLLVTLSTLLRGSIYEKLRWTFKLYDINGDGCITRSELGEIVLAIHELMGRRSHQHNFKLYDINGDGCITRSELGEIVLAIHELMGRRSHQVEEDRKAREHVDFVFRKLDINQDGVITLEEFIESCLKVAASVRLRTMILTVAGRGRPQFPADRTEACVLRPAGYPETVLASAIADSPPVLGARPLGTEPLTHFSATRGSGTCGQRLEITRLRLDPWSDRLIVYGWDCNTNCTVGSSEKVVRVMYGWLVSL